MHKKLWTSVSCQSVQFPRRWSTPTLSSLCAASVPFCPRGWQAWAFLQSHVVLSWNRHHYLIGNENIYIFKVSILYNNTQLNVFFLECQSEELSAWLRGKIKRNKVIREMNTELWPAFETCTRRSSWAESALAFKAHPCFPRARSHLLLRGNAPQEVVVQVHSAWLYNWWLISSNVPPPFENVRNPRCLLSRDGSLSKTRASDPTLTGPGRTALSTLPLPHPAV